MAYEKERWHCDVGGREIMCSYCKHREKGLVCKAFPSGIPRDLMMREEHDTPYPGDNGIRFEPKEE